MTKAKIKFWGVRGSMAAPSADTREIGGNTACLEICYGKTLIICDAGTGLRPLGNTLVRRAKKKPISAHILLSHLHWDHFIGLPFFKPIFHKRNSFVVAGPRAVREEFGRALSRVIRPPYFPLPIETFFADVKLKTIPERPFKIEKIKVRPIALCHPQGSFGWRFEFPNGKVLVHVTDNEPGTEAHAQKLVGWMRGADVVIHDSQYSPASYEKRKGWGHSPFTYPVRLAEEAGVKKLFLFHFDPNDTDIHLKEVLKEARSLIHSSKSHLKCELAREGLSFEL